MSDDPSLRASQDLFEDSLENIEISDTNVDDNIAWRGIELNSLKTGPYELIPSVTSSPFHTVGFKLPIVNGKCPEPYPKHNHDFWDAKHVQMPCSRKNVYARSEDEIAQTWPLIKEILSSDIGSGKELQEAIISYASNKSGHQWNFIALHKFFSESLSEPEAEYFFESVFPNIVDLALSLDSEVTGGLPLLRKRKSLNISLTQRQVACLLANAFLCTFPDRSFAKESFPYPSINFTRLFLQGGVLIYEKMKCFINYFRRVCSSNLDGVITFSRRSINPINLPSWLTSKKRFTQIHITSEGTIEDEGQGMLQIDFANKFVGGGVLGRGSLQEEITFLLCPELIVSRLFTECLDDTEALIITGAERFNRHTGYADSFKWGGNYDDSSTPRDSYQRKCRTIIALDALRFSDCALQYKPQAIFREINKAYCGFSFGCDVKDKISIATGNWGCGAFRGDPKLKALIQLIAAAQSDRNLAYFTFYDTELRNSIFDMYSFLINNNITVGHLCNALNKYHIFTKFEDITLYGYLYSSLLNQDEEPSPGTKGSQHCDGASVEGCAKIESKEEISNCPYNTEDPVDNMEADKSLAQVDTTVEDSVVELQLPSSEPISAETYSLKTEEGRKRCIESEKERWQAYESAKTLLSPNSEKNNRKHPPKKKISDYFAKTPPPKKT